MNLPALMATHQLRQREYLLRITRAMTSRLDLPSLLRLILTSAAEMVGCRGGLIALWEDGPVGVTDGDGAGVDGGRRFHVRALYGIPAELLPAFEPLLERVSFVQEWPDRGGAGETILDEDEKTIVVSRESSHGGAGHEEPGGAGGNGDRRHEWQIPDLQGRVLAVERNLGGKLGQVVGLLLLFEDELLGVIYLFRGDYAFTPVDHQVLQGFA
ncbi:MAG: hypothetical protein KAZ26_23120, partial [Caldilineaceae bacterium]|nr:hypothetical protein [Caldilineaceae bacterium]